MSLLADILARKRDAVAALRARPASSRPAAEPSSRMPFDAVATLRRRPGDPLRLIAEIKLRSPSAGTLSRVLSPAARAVAYAEAGAAMVSVLCDAPFFDGSWDHLEAARQALDARGLRVPLLAKDFVIDEVQIDEARRRGADAILLIARIVTPERLVELAGATRARGIEPLVEIVDLTELETAVRAKAKIIGVNARDLDTLAMDADRTARVLGAIDPGSVAIHLSGIKDAAGVAAIARGRADAALVGEALMRADDPRPLLQSLVLGSQISP
jgi:indole-3-glycerol phosphate synthase